MDTYRLILEELKRRAVSKDLEYTVHNLTQMGELMKSGTKTRTETGSALNKKEQKAMNAMLKSMRGGKAHSSDLSALSCNISVNNVAAGAPKTVYVPCKDCGMFCDGKGTCNFWDKDKKIFKGGNFIKHRSVRFINTDGTSIVNKFWAAKLVKFGFPAMNVTDKKEQEKILAELKKTCSSLPKASEEERRLYVEKNKRSIALSVVEDGPIGKSAKTNSKTKKKSGKAKASKKKSSAKDDSSSSLESSESLDNEEEDGSSSEESK